MDTVPKLRLESITRGLNNGGIPQSGLDSPRTAGATHTNDTGKSFLIGLGNLLKGDDGYIHDALEAQSKIVDGKKPALGVIYTQIADGLADSSKRTLSGNSDVIKITFNGQPEDLFVTTISYNAVEFKLGDETETVYKTKQEVIALLAKYKTPVDFQNTEIINTD